MYKISFCIPTYNSSQKTYRLVEKLLSIEDDDFQVVICDNCSEDDTVERLKKISDKRLKIHVNHRNLGPKLNFCRALDLGDGEFLYFIIGRDSIRPQNYFKLKSVLERYKDESVGYLYEESSAVYDGTKTLQYKGVRAFEEFIKPDHQTGMIFLRQAYVQIKNRRKYFEQKTDYCENYIKRDILNEYKGVKIIGMGFRASDIQGIKYRQSQFEKNNKIQYFYPERMRVTMLASILMVLNCKKIRLNMDEKNNYLAHKSQDFFQIQMDIWKINNENREASIHYSKETRRVSKRELLTEAVKTYMFIDKKLSKYYWYNKEKHTILFNSFMNNVKTILE